MTDDLKNFEKAPEADTPQTEDPTTLEMPTDDLAILKAAWRKCPKGHFNKLILNLP